MGISLNPGLKNTFILTFILGLIFFDAAQQKFYLDTFNLYPDGKVISYLNLWKEHFIRWSIFIVVSVPHMVFAQKSLQGVLSGIRTFRIILIQVATVCVALIGISLYYMALEGNEYSLRALQSLFLFFFFQKGLTFFMVSTGITIMSINHIKSKAIKYQSVEIDQLKSANSQLKSVQKYSIKLLAKVGNKEHSIDLKDIVWIQSDDYCVKIHTADSSFTVRQSLKSLQSKLAPYHFVRVHRSALFNTAYLDQIDYHRSKIRSTNNSEIPFSKTGIKSLKDRLPIPSKD